MQSNILCSIISPYRQLWLSSTLTGVCLTNLRYHLTAEATALGSSWRRDCATDRSVKTIMYPMDTFVWHQNHAVCVRERRSLPGNVVDHKSACGTAVVGAGDGPETLLSCRVPNLQLDFLSAHLDYPCTKLHADCMRAVCHNWRAIRMK